MKAHRKADQITADDNLQFQSGQGIRNFGDSRSGPGRERCKQTGSLDERSRGTARAAPEARLHVRATRRRFERYLETAACELSCCGRATGSVYEIRRSLSAPLVGSHALRVFCVFVCLFARVSPFWPVGGANETSFHSLLPCQPSCKSLIQVTFSIDETRFLRVSVL